MSGRAGETLHRDLMGGAQLTIFYSGKVNVYEDVPADKAHAIMLLLSNGSSNTISGSCDEFYRPGTSMSKPTQVINTDQPAAAANTNTFNSVGGDGVQFRSSTSPCPSPHRITRVEKKQLVIRRTQAELPFARKASLARFLEKRKDRVDGELIKESSDTVKVNLGSAACKKIKQ